MARLGDSVVHSSLKSGHESQIGYFEIFVTCVLNLG